jgi:hypothetical protein
MMKEQHAMERTSKQERLPEGMILVETTDGRWFPAFALSSDIPFRVYILERSPLIQPVRNSLHERVPGYTCREEAIEAFSAWNETCELTQDWRWLAALIEVYPERNAWYLDEIVQLTGGDDTPHLQCGIPVQAMVLARGIDSSEVITATGDTPDEAIETLYQRVYLWSCTHNVTPCERQQPSIRTGSSAQRWSLCDSCPV